MLLWRERSASSSDDEVDGAREMDVEGKGERVGRKLEREESEAEREESDAEHSYGEVNQEDKRSIALGVLTLCARASLQWRSEQCPFLFSHMLLLLLSKVP